MGLRQQESQSAILGMWGPHLHELTTLAIADCMFGGALSERGPLGSTCPNEPPEGTTLRVCAVGSTFLPKLKTYILQVRVTVSSLSIKGPSLCAHHMWRIKVSFRIPILTNSGLVMEVHPGCNQAQVDGPVLSVPCHMLSP